MGFFDWAGEKLNQAGDAVGDAAHAVGDFGQDMGAGVFGWETSAEEEARERAEQARNEGQRERDKLDAESRGLEQNVNAYDPPSIQDTENWASYSHKQIHQRNQKLDEGKVSQAADAWEKLAGKLRGMGENYARELNDIVRGGWQGQAADAAANVGEPVAKWMRNSADAFELTGNRVRSAGSAAGQAKQMVPAPSERGFAETLGSTLVKGASAPYIDGKLEMKEQREEERQAQDTMKRVLAASYQEADSQVPQYRDLNDKPVAPPEKPGGSAVPPTPSGPGGYGGGGAGGGAGGAGIPGGAASANYPQSGGGSGYPGGTSGAGYPGAQSPAGSSSAWSNPQAPGVPGAPGAGGLTPGGPGGAGGGAPGGMGAGGVAGGAGGYGRAGGGRAAGGLGPGGRAGSGSVGGSGGSGSSSGGGAGGASGRGGGRPMGGMGGGQRGEGGDEEHERPGWLEEWDDVWFNDMPKTAPPVLGE